jgi:hypothetical protein
VVEEGIGGKHREIYLHRQTRKQKQIEDLLSKAKATGTYKEEKITKKQLILPNHHLIITQLPNSSEDHPERELQFQESQKFRTTTTR